MMQEDKILNKKSKTKNLESENSLPNPSLKKTISNKFYLIILLITILIGFIGYYNFVYVSGKSLHLLPSGQDIKIIEEKKKNEDVQSIDKENNSHEKLNLLNQLDNLLKAPSLIKPEEKTISTENLSLGNISVQDKKFYLYKSYLIEVNELIINFLQDKSFSTNLKKLNPPYLPDEIKSILQDLENYEATLKDKENKKEKIFPLKCKILEKFISIERKGKDKDLSILARQKAVDLIIKLSHYFYSSDFQEKFMKEGD